ncbi:flavin reductase family protein [Desulfotomaculum copahuensis]|uniref:Flavin reductase n=1 Tax=Desulfotomaculum copahuensis TaxID=1838280 RepID=A0A1B7LJL9_9FIRM|nr:flavin reductase family protein [Desulfotomaculum copahuensis]OAT86743.1 flavin reductase [Desulfotomaculum copahuensis]
MAVEVKIAVNTLIWPVCLVGAKENDKHNVMTAAWVSQVSANPLLVMVSVAPGRYSHDMIVRTGEFMVSVLSAAQQEVSTFCGSRSGRDVDKIARLNLQTKPAEAISVPRLSGCVANLECKVTGQHTAGDHTLFIGEVVAADVAAADVQPLIMYRGKTVSMR